MCAFNMQYIANIMIMHLCVMEHNGTAHITCLQGYILIILHAHIVSTLVYTYHI